MQAGHLLQDGRRHLGGTRGDLVPLRCAGDVLEKEREPSGLGLDLRDVGSRDAGTDTGGDLLVKAHLYLVGPQCQARAAALVVGRGELADHAGRSRPGFVVREDEAARVGHLARSDRTMLEGDDPGARGQRTRPEQGRGQPIRADVGGAAEEVRRAHDAQQTTWLAPS